MRQEHLVSSYVFQEIFLISYSYGTVHSKIFETVLYHQNSSFLSLHCPLQYLHKSILISVLLCLLRHKICPGASVNESSGLCDHAHVYSIAACIICKSAFLSRTRASKARILKLECFRAAQFWRSPMDRPHEFLHWKLNLPSYNYTSLSKMFVKWSTSAFEKNEIFLFFLLLLQ